MYHIARKYGGELNLAVLGENLYRVHVCMAILFQTKSANTQFGGKPPNLMTANISDYTVTVSYTHLRAHETLRYLVCRLLLEKKK